MIGHLVQGLRQFAVGFAVLMCLATGAAASPAKAQGTGAPAQNHLDEVNRLKGKKIVEVRFRGNRRVESEAVALEISSAVNKTVDVDRIGSDIRKIWALGYFEDVQVESEETPAGVILTFVLRERPTIRKIIVEGNNKIKLDDINDVLDLAQSEVLDLGKVATNVEKVRSLYTEQGFFLAEVSYLVRAVHDEAGKVDVVLVVAESSEVIVRRVDFVGNKAISDEDLRKNMFTRAGSFFTYLNKKAGGVFNRDMFAQDYALLRQFYADKGYHEADFKDAEMAMSADRRFVYITIPVTEGPLYHISAIGGREVLTKGETQLYQPRDLDEIIGNSIRPGDVASFGKINEARESLDRLYKDAGHAYVNVVPTQKMDRKNRRLDLAFEIDKGPLVYIERIDISGNAKTADKVIRRELAIREGDLYSETAKDATQGRVMRLGFFSAVNVNTARGSADDKIVLHVSVTEQLTGTFQVGAGFSTFDNFIFNAQISYQNFLGRGSQVQLMAQLSKRRRQFNFSYYDRYFLDSKLNFQLSLFNSRTYLPAFTRENTGFTTNWGYPIPRMPRTTVFAGYSLQYVKATSGGGSLPGAGILSGTGAASIQKSQLLGNLFSRGYTSSVSFQLAYEGRDNMIYPTQGFYLNLDAEFASPYFRSQNVYNRYKMDGRFYVPVIRTDKQFRAWLVFKSRLQLGFVHNQRPGGVPIFERYFPGGIWGDGGLRGFTAYSLGPRIQVASSPDPDAGLTGYAVGGNLLAALNVELEGMILPQANIKGVLFYDMGNAFNTESVHCDRANPDALPKADPCSGFKFSDLRHSIGLGVRWVSPIGPLRFEWGFPLDRRDQTELLGREDTSNFEFNIGTSF
jgi:outer membrane protein insertion porin family